MRGPKYEGQKMREHQLAEGEASPLLCVPRSLTRVAVAESGELGMGGGEFYRETARRWCVRAEM